MSQAHYSDFTIANSADGYTKRFYSPVEGTDSSEYSDKNKLVVNFICEREISTAKTHGKLDNRFILVILYSLNDFGDNE